MISRYTFTGQRRTFRREGEGGGAYVDRYSPHLLGALLFIVLLCALDALFTLVHIQRGGSEMNPVMRMVIEEGALRFLFIKCGLTAAGLMFLCLHVNFRHVKAVIGGILGFYVLLIAYHIYLAAMR